MSLSEIYAMARKRPEQEFMLNRVYGSQISPLFTYLFARAGASPDQMTLVGALCGGTGAALLFLPLGWVSIVGVFLMQLGYILDFSDGQIARLRGIGSAAGGYLDWLTHLYIPVAAALGMASSLAWSTETFAFLVVGAMAALVLAAFAFSGKEHLLAAMLRNDPRLGGLPAYQAALRDDARAADVIAATRERSTAKAGSLGRFRTASWRGLAGELLIYPGAVHLLTLAVVVDLAAGLGDRPLGMRALVMVGWAALLVVHVPRVVQRNYRIIRSVEEAARQSQTTANRNPTGGGDT